MGQRTTVNFRDEDYKTLEELKDALGLPASQTLGLALQLTGLIRKYQENNSELIVRNQDASEATIHVLGLNPKRSTTT